jgi:hypothetical protein
VGHSLAIGFRRTRATWKAYSRRVPTYPTAHKFYSLCAMPASEGGGRGGLSLSATGKCRTPQPFRAYVLDGLTWGSRYPPGGVSHKRQSPLPLVPFRPRPPKGTRPAALSPLHPRAVTRPGLARRWLIAAYGGTPASRSFAGLSARRKSGGHAEDGAGNWRQQGRTDNKIVRN